MHIYFKYLIDSYYLWESLETKTNNICRCILKFCLVGRPYVEFNNICCSVLSQQEMVPWTTKDHHD